MQHSAYDTAENVCMGHARAQIHKCVQGQALCQPVNHLKGQAAAEKANLGFNCPTLMGTRWWVEMLAGTPSRRV
jgi:hypothetical protein